MTYWYVWSDGLTEEAADQLVKWWSEHHPNYSFRRIVSEFHGDGLYSVEGKKNEKPADTGTGSGSQE